MQGEDLIAIDTEALGMDGATITFGTKAVGDSAQIIYDAPTGRMWVDWDGDGAGKKRNLATLEPGIELTEADFQIL